MQLSQSTRKFWYWVDDTEYNFDIYTWKIFTTFFVALNYVSQGFSPQSAYVGWKYRFGSHQPIVLVTGAMKWI